MGRVSVRTSYGHCWPPDQRHDPELPAIDDTVWPMNDDGRGRSRLLAVMGWPLRWHARSHVQACLITAIGFLVCAVAFPIIAGWPSRGAISFVGLAAPWIGVGFGQSYDLARRRNSGVQR